MPVTGHYASRYKNGTPSPHPSLGLHNLITKGRVWLGWLNAITRPLSKVFKVPPADAPSSPAPAVTHNSNDLALDVAPVVSENVTLQNVPGVGVDNPQTPDFAAENQNFINQNVFNDVQFYDSAIEGDGSPRQTRQDEPISAERRQEIDSIKSRASDNITRSMDSAQQDKFYGNAIDTARNLTAANPEDRQKQYSDAMNAIPPDQRETFNKALGVALHDQGSNLRTGNEPPMGLLIDKSDPSNEKIVGKVAIPEMSENFPADQRAFNAAPAVKDSINKAFADVPENQQEKLGKDIGTILATQESNGLFAPVKDIGSRERPAGLPSEQEQAAKLKSQLSPQTGTEPVVSAAVEAANKIAFAKPEDMNKLFNEGMDNLRKAGIDPSSAAPILSQALNNISKDLRVSTTSGDIDQAFLKDKRLATPANPEGTIGVADTGTAPGDAAANNAAFTRASDIAAAIRTTNTEQLGRTPSDAEVKDQADRVFRILRYF